MTIDVTQKKEEGKRRTEKSSTKLEVRTSDESNRDGGTDGSGAGDNFVALKRDYFDGGMSVCLSL